MYAVLHQILQRVQKYVRQPVASKTSGHFRGDMGREVEVPRDSVGEGNPG